MDWVGFDWIVSQVRLGCLGWVGVHFQPVQCPLGRIGSGHVQFGSAGGFAWDAIFGIFLAMVTQLFLVTPAVLLVTESGPFGDVNMFVLGDAIMPFGDGSVPFGDVDRPFGDAIFPVSVTETFFPLHTHMRYIYIYMYTLYCV